MGRYIKQIWQREFERQRALKQSKSAFVDIWQPPGSDLLDLSRVRCNEGPIGFALDAVSQWHTNYRFVNGFLAEMEATIAFSPLENWGQEGCDPSKPVSLHPARYRSGGDHASSTPAAPRGSSEGTSSQHRPRAQRKQAAGHAAPFRREEHPPANVNFYVPRAESGILGCDGCGREGHTAEQCYSRKHPNWIAQHATVKWKDSAIAKEIRKLANENLRSLPLDGVQWLPEDKLWDEGEKLKAWKARMASTTVQSQHSSNQPDQNSDKVIHLGVVRGGSYVYPSLQGTIASMSMES